jgi:pimeloyl-ACP methyl ester carboxylesterase
MTLTQLRNRYSGRYFEEIQLPSGLTHYQVTGEGPVVVLVHGVSGPLAVWDKSTDALVAAGYKVVRYDLFGRGFSERLPESSYSLATYVKQLEELVDALHLGPKIRLVGSSLGGMITTEFTLQHPSQVDGLVLIGPAGFPIQTPLAARLRVLPIVGNLLTDLLSYKTILKQNDHYFANGRVPDELRPYIADQLLIPGTTNAILKTMKNSPVQSFVTSYEALGKLGLPVGLIWGRQDDTFSFDNAKIFLAAAPQARLITVENAGHLPQYERAEEVNPALIRLERMFDDKRSSTVWSSSRLIYPKATNVELTSTVEENAATFDQPFFQQHVSEFRDLELKPGATKTYRFPTFYDQETIGGALFLCSYDEAAKLLPSPLRPVNFGFGRAAVAISSFRYGSVRGMKPYNEVAIAILVSKAGSNESSAISILKSKGRKFSSYVVSMPVTSLENQIRGQRIWGLPKKVREIDLRQFGNEFVTTVYDEAGVPYLELRVPMAGKSEAFAQDTTLHSQLSSIDQVSSSKAEGVILSTLHPGVLIGAGISKSGYSSMSLSESTEADILRELKIIPAPIKTIFGIEIRSILTLPSVY